MNDQKTYLVIFLTLIIVCMKILWIRKEIKYSHQKISTSFFKNNFIEALILLLQIVSIYLTPLPTTKWDTIIISIGIIMVFFGSALAIWGLISIGSSWGLPGTATTGKNELLTHGAFVISRNPIYTGFILLYVGYCMALKSWLIVLRIPLIIYFYTSSIREEKILEQKFGTTYLNYKIRVPRFLFF